MPHQPVKSSTISSVSWEPPGVLEIVFKSGDVHRYAGVSNLEYSRLMAAPSKGTYFNKEIKGKYKSVKVGKGKPQPR